MANITVYYYTALSVVLLIILFTWWIRKSRESQPIKCNYQLIPGPKQQPSIGNLNEIRASGGTHPYLKHLHEEYGDVLTFAIGTQQCVSLASVETFKKVRHLFDRPKEAFQSYLPLIGQESIQIANGLEGQDMHSRLSEPFSFSNCKHYHNQINEIGANMIKTIKSFPPESHIPICQLLKVAAIKTIAAVAFGQSVTDACAEQFANDYDVAFEATEAFLLKVVDEPVDKEKENLATLRCRQFARMLLESRQKQKFNDEQQNRFADVLLDYGWDSNKNVDNAITFIIGGFHTTSFSLSWMLHYLANYPDIQDKLYDEIQSVLESKEDIGQEETSKMMYLRQVTDETIRYTAFAGFAARCSDNNIVVNKHCTIPAKTPIILPLGVIQNNSKYWENPDSFDPDRFEQNLHSHPPLAFTPFGFAGGRVCPGMQLARAEIAIIVSLLLREFRILPSDDTIIERIYGLITKPKPEICIKVSPRNVK